MPPMTNLTFIILIINPSIVDDTHNRGVKKYTSTYATNLISVFVCIVFHCNAWSEFHKFLLSICIPFPCAVFDHDHYMVQQ